VSQAVIRATKRLCPLVAIQPVYMHPYSVARWSLRLRSCTPARVPQPGRRRLKKDLEALNDLTAARERYARLVEYATGDPEPARHERSVSFEGRYYKVSNLKLTPALPARLQRAC